VPELGTECAPRPEGRMFCRAALFKLKKGLFTAPTEKGKPDAPALEGYCCAGKMPLYSCAAAAKLGLNWGYVEGRPNWDATPGADRPPRPEAGLMPWENEPNCEIPEPDNEG
jgi:hypothetical protein